MKQPYSDVGGDRYFAILNTLSGKANEKIIDFINWIFQDPNLNQLYEMLLGCDDPSPMIEELWFYYITGMDPGESPTFKEFAIKYIPLSISLNFQIKDNDLSKKALLVGNVQPEKKDYEDLL